MKKIMVLLGFASIFLITGCANSNDNTSAIINTKKIMTCTKETVDEDEYKILETMVITYKNSDVLNVDTTIISETNPDFIDMQLSIVNAVAENFNGLDGIKLNYSKLDNNKIKMQMFVDYNEIDVNQIKSTLGEIYSEEDSIYDKKYTIEEFKKENLEGYSCK